MKGVDTINLSYAWSKPRKQATNTQHIGGCCFEPEVVPENVTDIMLLRKGGNETDGPETRE